MELRGQEVAMIENGTQRFIVSCGCQRIFANRQRITVHKIKIAVVGDTIEQAMFPQLSDRRPAHVRYRIVRATAHVTGNRRYDAKTGHIIFCGTLCK